MEHRTSRTSTIDSNFGINWWASTQWKVGFSYGDADLNRFGLLGDTKVMLARIQWLY